MEADTGKFFGSAKTYAFHDVSADKTRRFGNDKFKEVTVQFKATV